MSTGWIEKVTGSLDDKKRWRRYKARIEALPEPYESAAKAIQRYFMVYGGMTLSSADMLQMLDDHADLWERAAADETPVSQIVGDDPVAFAETFADAYSGKRWIDKERERLAKAVDAVVDHEKGTS